MVQRVRASLARGDGSARPQVLVGCSGGKDSLALTVVIAALVQAGALTAEIVHVDHASRASSAAAASGVQDIGDRLGLTCHIVTLDTNAVDRHPGVGVEEALRRERYLAYADVARATGARTIALAHHQRDQAETIVLHLIRGSGLAGAAAMREWSERVVPWWTDISGTSTPLGIWRPLLGERYEAIAGIATASGLPIFEDETNEDRRFRRNAVRHDFLPMLESIAVGATANIARFAALAAEDETALDELATADGQDCLTADGGLRRGPLVTLNVAIQRRVVRSWILRSSYDGELTSNRVEAVLELVQRNRSGASVEIGRGWTVSLSGGMLALRHG